MSRNLFDTGRLTDSPDLTKLAPLLVVNSRATDLMAAVDRLMTPTTDYVIGVRGAA